MEQKLLIPANGANVILLDNEDNILCVRANYGEKKWILPGGKIERSETSLDAVVSELAEETGLIARAKDMKFLALLYQYAGSNVSLFSCEQYEGAIFDKPNSEISEWRFMTIEAIVDSYRKQEFARGYAVMAVVFDNIRRGLLTPPLILRMFDPVPYLPESFI